MERTSASSPRRGLRFVLILVALAVAFELAFVGYLANGELYASYLELNVRATERLLRLLGVGASSEGLTLTAGGGSIVVRRGCDAVEPAALFLFAVLLFPASWPRRLGGALAGVALLSALNLVRLASLVLLQPRSEKAFQILHLAVWPTVMIACAVALWVMWALAAQRPRT